LLLFFFLTNCKACMTKLQARRVRNVKECGRDGTIFWALGAPKAVSLTASVGLSPSPFPALKRLWKWQVELDRGIDLR